MPLDPTMEQQDAGGQGDNRYDSTPPKRCRGSAEIGNEPSEDADIRYYKNSQPDLNIGNFFLCNVKLGHEVNAPAATFANDTPGLCWRGLIGIGRSLAAPPSHTTGRTGHLSGDSMI
jgi:hypothetical protein